MNLKGLICIAITSLVIGCAVESSRLSKLTAASAESNVRTQSASPLEPEPTPETEQSIDHKGARLQNKISASSRIVAIEEKAQYLEDETDKPDSVVPNYLSFKFHGDYANSNSESFLKPG